MSQLSATGGFPLSPLHLVCQSMWLFRPWSSTGSGPDRPLRYARPSSILFPARLPRSTLLVSDLSLLLLSGKPACLLFPTTISSFFFVLFLLPLSESDLILTKRDILTNCAYMCWHFIISATASILGQSTVRTHNKTQDHVQSVLQE